MNDKITYRESVNFANFLITEFLDQLENYNIAPSNWPIRFPITIKIVSNMPEIPGQKIAKRVVEVVRIMWKDIRTEAIKSEKNMFYNMLYDLNPEEEMTYIESSWAILLANLEHAAGVIKHLEIKDEDEIKKYICNEFLSSRNLEKFKTDFKEDYNNFLNDIRGLIRYDPEIKASEKMELLSLLNENNQNLLGEY